MCKCIYVYLQIITELGQKQYLHRTMLRFGENLVNTLGLEVDRIESDIQAKFPGKLISN